MTDWAAALSDAFARGAETIGNSGNRGNQSAEHQRSRAAVRPAPVATGNPPVATALSNPLHRLDDAPPVVATVATIVDQVATEFHSSQGQGIGGQKGPVATVATGNKHADHAVDRVGAAVEFDERAAIIEHDAGVPREWAEGFARLDLSRPPAGYPAADWHRFIDRAGMFLDEWAAKAAALGWTAEAAFGLDAAKPFARLDCTGLVGLLGPGDRVVAITSETAAIEKQSGGRLTFYRQESSRWSRPAWELVRPLGRAPTTAASPMCDSE